ncbi:unnamed protein product [Prorocentrum cordatum]|uniref:Glycerophosphocholine acyltransferase 1 n=1 Tax=Prorocentrum cordatum TaxID=2364126 RepID=A0ABN9WIB2_9DINO|nr:unnamed protein product [Polarella glacialis]
MLVLRYLCFLGCFVFQPALSSTEAGVTCNKQWCNDFFGDCLAGTETQPCSCEKGVPRVIDKPSHISAFSPRFFQFTCCTEGDLYNFSSPARFTFDRDVCGNYSSTHMMVSCVLAVMAFAMGAVFWVGGRLCYWYVDRPAKTTAEDEDVDNPTNVLDGSRLHNIISAHRWCVTRTDLEQFRRLVRRAVLDGRIKPTETDMFDPTENVIGPCVYSVTDQYIKPVTARAGNPSWALMLHPDGLACDLFITHSWQEGIYELIDKVMYSWPAGKSHAYICFLSNPQNLDIAHLVSSPTDSPFAHALRSATDMMVVPNRKGSIYSRVWCVYEAHLAYTLDKQIFCAASPVHNFWPRVVSRLGECFVGLSIGAACCIILVFCAFDHLVVPFRNLCILAMFVTKIRYNMMRKTPSCTACRRSCCVVVLFAGISLGVVLQMDLMHLVNWAGALLLCAFGLCMEADRLWAVIAVREKVSLCLGYTGHVRDARCSVNEDGQRIRAELLEGSQELAVDQSVECLIRTGLSTRHLRDTAQRVGKLGNVTNWYFASIVMHAGVVWVWFPAHSLWANVCILDNGISAYICILQGLIWSVLFTFVLSKDRKAFAVMSLDTLLICLALRAVNTCAFLFTMSLVVGPFVMVLTLAGPANVARMPLAGPAMVRFFIGDWDLRNPCARHQPFSEELQNSQHELAEMYGKLEQDLVRDSRSSLSSRPSDLARSFSRPSGLAGSTLSSRPPDYEGARPTNRMSRAGTLPSCEGDSSTSRQSYVGTLSSQRGELAVRVAEV